MDYVVFALADGMFPSACTIRREPLTVDEVKVRLAPDHPMGPVVVCANPSHGATFAALAKKHGVRITPPANAPKVTLKRGDHMIVVTITGLPRLEGRHEYTSEEIAGATFKFGWWMVL